MAVVKIQQSKVEEEIFELWKELNPSSAFTAGLDDYAGKLFVPTEGNMKRMLEKIAKLKTHAEDTVQQKFLQCLETELRFEEPYMALESLLWVFYRHLVKEGIKVEHLLSLTSHAKKSLRASKERLTKREWPIEIRAITCYEGNSLIGILETIRNETENEQLQEELYSLKGTVDDYVKAFHLEGVKEGSFEEVFPILEREGGDIGRKEIYPKLLKDLYDYPETANEIESKALRWLREELPRLMKIAEELARTYGIETKVELVANEITKRRNVDKSRVLEFVSDMRKKLQKVVEGHLVRVTSTYDTRVLETPSYLVSLITTAATDWFDTLTEKPFNLFFVTTDPKRSAPASAPDLINDIIHEEYGHCINHSNSATNFAAKPRLIELLETTLGQPISEAISFFREVEFISLLKQLARKKEELTRDEKKFLDALRAIGDLDIFILETEFIVVEWRVLRFLRAIGDVRINMGKQSATEFINWAHEQTGLSKKMLYNEIFTFQDSPGYAPCYCMAGEELRKIQSFALEKGKSVIDFNTYVSSMGYTPRTVYEKRLRKYAVSTVQP
ncbi:MAG: hypothetical protein OEX76_01655 [Candidatus Bathyarchaeota archaeon]|nr:hypothetical protein [Candidatus Bathyarchaeota archaeon]